MQNDKLELLKPGSLQHLGENMLSFLIHVAASSHLPKSNTIEEEENTGLNAATFFDILVPITVISVLGLTPFFRLFPFLKKKKLKCGDSNTCCNLREHI
jgi:hypothetical protein